MTQTQKVPDGTPLAGELTAYCVRCSDKKVMTNPVTTTFRNGRPAATGACPDCNTKLNRILKSS